MFEWVEKVYLKRRDTTHLTQSDAIAYELGFSDAEKQLYAAFKNTVDLETLKLECTEKLHGIVKVGPKYIGFVVSDIIDHLAAQGYIGVPGGWRDIGSAPKEDGKEILARFEYDCLKPKMKKVGFISMEYKHGRWVFSGSPHAQQLTHWMPADAVKAAPKKED